MIRPSRLWSVWILALAIATAVQAQEQTQLTFDDIPWEKGPVLGDLGSEANVRVPEHCLFTRGDGVRKFMELTQNTTNPNERGVVYCEGEAENGWFVVFTYDASGYVKDDERDELDPDAILTSIREGQEAGNQERRKRGWGTLSIDGWTVKPYYDSATNNLTWATALSESSGGHSVNHSVRLLGRGGVMHVDLVAGPESYQAVTPIFNDLVGGFTFRNGHQYSEWRSGDKVAAYGLTALVAGGVGAAAAKSGILAKLWKVLVAAGVAAAAGLKSLFGRKKSGEANTSA